MYTPTDVEVIGFLFADSEISSQHPTGHLKKYAPK